MIDLLSQLVAFDTTSGRPTRPIIEFIVDRLGPDVRAHLYPDASGDLVNLVAVAGPEPDPARPGLTLCGHIDVVPATEPEWTSDPFTLTRREDRLAGRGSADMKGFVALAVRAMREAAMSGTLRRPLALILTHSEEIGSLGMQSLARALPPDHNLPRAAIVGEPTGLGAVRMHKGHLKLRMTVKGRAAHSGTPHLGRNAIEPAARLVDALAAYRHELESVHTDTSDYFPEAPYPVLNVASIHGGGAVNVIPDRCAIELGIRLLPGMTSTPHIARIEDIARRATGASRIDAEVINDNPPMLLHANAPIHAAALEILGQAGSRGVPFASDAGVMARDLDTDCILWGPGHMDVAHKPDEFIAVEQLERATEYLDAFIRRFAC